MQMKKAVTSQLYAKTGKYFFKMNLILFEIDNVYC